MRLIDADEIVYDIYDDEGTMVVTADNIAKMPTVDAEPIRHGRFVTVYEYSVEEHRIYKCSECGELYDWFDVPEHKYCRNCGAKMDLPEPMVYPQVEGITPIVVKMDEVTE